MGGGDVLCKAKTYVTARIFVASAVGFVAFCVANATARIARRTHFSWLTRLLKRHRGDDNKHAYLRAQVYQHIPSDAHKRELLSKKLKKGTNGVYWLMEYFYTHDDDYHLTAFKPFATL